MERRLHRRILVSLKAEFMRGNKRYTGYIENLSEDGVRWHRYVGDIDSFSDNNICMVSGTDFKPGTTLELELFFPTGKTLILHCKVIWSHVAAPDGFLKRIGMKIIDPPVQYTEYVKTLQ